MEGNIISRLNIALAWAAKRRAISVGLPTLAVIVVTIFLFFYVRNLEKERVQQAFIGQAMNYSNAMIENINLYHEILYSIRSFYAASVHVDRNEFNAFTQHNLDRFKGIQALEWIPRVAGENRYKYEQSAVNNGLTGYQFKKWSSDGKWVATNEHWAKEYFPVFYMQPHEGNKPALGIDLASNPTRLAALEKSRDTGAPVATARIILAQDADQQSGFLIFIPIYKNNEIIDTVEKRREHLIGFILGVFRISDIINSSTANLDSNDIVFRITDESAGGEQQLLFKEDGVYSNDQLSSLSNELHYSVGYRNGGRDWRLSFMATADFIERNKGSESLLIGIAGISIAALLALMLFLVTQRSLIVERLVEQRTEELARTNEALIKSNIELEQFAYIASHDLQAPLRGISGFAQFLQKDYFDRLDDNANQYIEQIVEGAKRMQTLIKDLLTYSRLDSLSRPFVETNLNNVFDDVVILLGTAIEEVSGKVTRDDLPIVIGDRAQLSQLLHNLIGNGIKYFDKQPPNVHISAKKNNNEWIISVKDNGIGIEPKHHNRIFKIFHRLYSQEQYSGTGIGLAVCQRIAKHHNSRIWLESELGVGTTFYFAISCQSSGNKV